MDIILLYSLYSSAHQSLDLCLYKLFYAVLA